MTFRRRLEPKNHVDLIPMIDVVVNILIFFIVSTTFNVTPAITLTLPRSNSADTTAVTTLTLTVAGPQDLYLNKEKFTLSTLNQKLKSMGATEKKAVKSVMVNGDEGVSYALMVQVLDVLRNNGFSSVSLKTKGAAP